MCGKLKLWKDTCCPLYNTLGKPCQLTFQDWTPFYMACRLHTLMLAPCQLGVSRFKRSLFIWCLTCLEFHIAPMFYDIIIINKLRMLFSSFQRILRGGDIPGCLPDGSRDRHTPRPVRPDADRPMRHQGLRLRGLLRQRVDAHGRHVLWKSDMWRQDSRPNPGSRQHLSERFQDLFGDRIRLHSRYDEHSFE